MVVSDLISFQVGYAQSVCITKLDGLHTGSVVKSIVIVWTRRLPTIGNKPNTPPEECYARELDH